MEKLRDLTSQRTKGGSQMYSLPDGTKTEVGMERYYFLLVLAHIFVFFLKKKLTTYEKLEIIRKTLYSRLRVTTHPCVQLSEVDCTNLLTSF